MRTLLLTGALSILLSVHAFAAPSDAEIRKILHERIDLQKQSLGIVVGIIEPGGRRIVGHGVLSKIDTQAPNGDTVFQIGSVTKIFTALLLADMAQKGEVALTDPVAKLLPERTRVPDWNGHPITLQDLATQTSGLPRLPTNLKPREEQNPYADYSERQLYRFLEDYKLTRDTGTQYEYSNLGFGLLGHALTRKLKTNYETAIRTRICEPLGLRDTRTTLTLSMHARSATGHNAQLQPVPDWDFDVLAGAGALRSTANDLLTFLAANLTNSSLGPAMRSLRATTRPTATPDLEIGLGWHIFKRHGSEIVWHNGGTYGYASFIGFDPQARVGVVVLSNAFTVHAGNIGVDDIGLHLLNEKFPLTNPEPPKERVAIGVDAQILKNYEGRYRLTPDVVITITRKKDRLFAQVSGQSKQEIFAETPTNFFYKSVDAEIAFETDNTGQVTRIVLHQLGQSSVAPRIQQ